jgi:hypothetical protein
MHRANDSWPWNPRRVHMRLVRRELQREFGVDHTQGWLKPFRRTVSVACRGVGDIGH